MPEDGSPSAVERFMARWTGGHGGAERANYAMFLIELCDLLGLSHKQLNGWSSMRVHPLASSGTRFTPNAP